MGKVWKLQEARDHFSELIRRTETEGAQTITVHGREKAVIISCSDYRRITNEVDESGSRHTGRDLVEFFRSSPLYGLDIEVEREAGALPEAVNLDE